jgi:hypothetical protein
MFMAEILEDLEIQGSEDASFFSQNSVYFAQDV